MPKPRENRSVGPSEFGGSAGVVQPAITPNGAPGHTPDPSELASLQRRTGDPTGLTLHEDLTPAQITEALNGLEPSVPSLPEPEDWEGWEGEGE